MAIKTIKSKTFNKALYHSWYDANLRCFKLTHKQYKDYGARGITMDSKWLKFANFKADMEKNYKRGLFLERINNNGNYCKENCKWATRIEQNNNTRRSRFVDFQGVTKTLAQWIKILNLKSSTVKQRYYVYHWSIEKSLGY